MRHDLFKVKSFVVAMFFCECKHKLICICWVVPEVTSPPAQSYAQHAQRYTDKPLFTDFWQRATLFRSGGHQRLLTTNTQSAALGPDQEIEEAPKKLFQEFKNRQKSTRRLGETMRLAELLKSGRTFISFWCFFPHRHLLFSSHTPRNATWSFVVSGWLVSGSVTSCAGIGPCAKNKQDVRWPV